MKKYCFASMLFAMISVTALAEPMDTVTCNYSIQQKQGQYLTWVSPKNADGSQKSFSFPLVLKSSPYHERSTSQVIEIPNTDLQVAFTYTYYPSSPSDVSGQHADPAQVMAKARLQRVDAGKIQILAMGNGGGIVAYPADVGFDIHLPFVDEISKILNSIKADPAISDGAINRALSQAAMSGAFADGTMIDMTFSCDANWQ